VHALIGAALAQAERWDMVEKNVARRASPPAVHASPVEAPDLDQVRALIAEVEASDPMIVALLAIAALTGARRGELCALRWSDVDWQAGLLTVPLGLRDQRWRLGGEAHQDPPGPAGGTGQAGHERPAPAPFGR
jgi:integrase